jgi:hypothetical protein
MRALPNRTSSQSSLASAVVHFILITLLIYLISLNQQTHEAAASSLRSAPEKYKSVRLAAAILLLGCIPETLLLELPPGATWAGIAASLLALVAGLHALHVRRASSHVH